MARVAFIGQTFFDVALHASIDRSGPGCDVRTLRAEAKKSPCCIVLAVILTIPNLVVSSEKD